MTSEEGWVDEVLADGVEIVCFLQWVNRTRFAEENSELEQCYIALKNNTDNIPVRLLERWLRDEIPFFKKLFSNFFLLRHLCSDRRILRLLDISTISTSFPS